MCICVYMYRLDARDKESSYCGVRVVHKLQEQRNRIHHKVPRLRFRLSTHVCGSANSSSLHFSSEEINVGEDSHETTLRCDEWDTLGRHGGNNAGMYMMQECI